MESPEKRGKFRQSCPDKQKTNRNFDEKEKGEKGQD